MPRQPGPEPVPGSGSSKQLDGAVAKNARNVERLRPSRSSSSPHSQNRIFPVKGSPSPTPLWENLRACAEHGSCPGVGTRAEGPRALALQGRTQWVCVGSA